MQHVLKASIFSRPFFVASLTPKLYDRNILLQHSAMYAQYERLIITAHTLSPNQGAQLGQDKE